MISSFKATGIYPFDRERVLRKLPDNSPSPELDTVIRDSLTEFLREQRFGKQSEPARKKKRLNVVPGKSISTIDDLSCSGASQNDDVVEESPPIEPVAAINEPSTSQNVANIMLNDDDVTDCEFEESESEDRPQGPEIGQFILAKFRSEKGKKTYHYVCSIEDISEDKLVVQSQNKSKLMFREVPEDLSIIEESDIPITFLKTPNFDNNSYKFPAEVMVKEL